MSGQGDDPASVSVDTPRSRRRWLRWLLLPVLVVLLLPLLAYVLLASEGGSRWLLHQASQLAPEFDARFEFAESRGALLDRIELDGVAIEAAGAQVAIDELQLQWQPRALMQRLLHVELLSAQGVKVAPPPPTPPEPATVPELPDIQLPISVRLDRLVVDDVRVQQADGEFVLDHASLAAAVDASAIALDTVQLRALGAAVDGSLQMAPAAPHAVQGALTVELPASLTGDDVGDVSLAANVAGEALRPEIDLSVSAPTELRLQAVAALDKVQPSFEIDANWPQLRWPLRGEAQVSAEAGSLHLAGAPDDYRLKLRAPVQVPQQPRIDLALDAIGDLAGMTLAPLRLDVAEGSVTAQGKVGWQDGVSWQLRLQAQGLDPGQFAAEWPGSIDAVVAVEGALPAQGALEIDAMIEKLAGTLREYPVSADGGVSLRGGVLQARSLYLASASNRVRLDGRAGDTLDLNFTIDAPELAALYPGLAGTLKGQGIVTGQTTSPAIDAQLRGSALAFEEARVASMILDLDWRGEAGTGELQLTELASGGNRLGAVTAAIDGRLDAHRVQLTADGPDGRLALGADGGLDPTRTKWQGTLQQLDATAVELGAWQLREPTAAEFAADKVRVERLCLARAQTALCLRGGWAQKEGLDLQGDLRDFDLGTLARYLPGEAVIDGSLAARFDLAGPPQRPRATFELVPGDGLIRVEEGLEPFELGFRNARLRGEFRDDRGSADLNFELGSNGRANGRVVLGADNKGRRALSGQLNADFPDLALVAGFVPALQAVKGKLALALKLGGSLAEPTVDGKLRVSDAGADVPAAGITLTDVDLRVQGDGRGPLQVGGALRSGDGSLALRGEVDPGARGGAAVDIRVSGSDFQAVQLPEARAWVSPDLRLQGNGPYRLTGTLRIPRAAIELKELPKGTVALSDDVVIVGNDGPVKKPPAGSPVEARVRVELGDAVSFKGFGLSTRLDGAVDAVSNPRGTVVDGKIELRDATYKAYGQDLTVERGRLLFAGPPGNPDVDLRAVRVSRDGQVRAYLAMSGPLAKPRPRVYTEPALPEAEAVAYLLTGQGLDSAGAGEGLDIASAALSLGMSRSEPLLQDLGDRLGLDDVKIESGSNGIEDSALLLGKYLNPDLYLGYSQGLFNTEGAVLLRLRLSKRLELESRSGNEQSVDLFYKIEHN
ncbi:MAG: translocation/assembly module TamB domain-containing protein [Gammaproteobacteria bacterium]|nr:translocation/assembly module TamB domain-containing protein [Gammaproteobacteria bacterium]